MILLLEEATTVLLRDMIPPEPPVLCRFGMAPDEERFCRGEGLLEVRIDGSCKFVVGVTFVADVRWCGPTPPGDIASGMNTLLPPL